LRHEIFLFSLQLSATLINLAQNGQIFYDNQAHKVKLPKMGKCFTTIAGQSGWPRHWYWLSCLRYGQSCRHRGLWHAKPSQTMLQALQIEIWKLYISGVLSIFTMSRLNRETKNSLLP